MKNRYLRKILKICVVALFACSCGKNCEVKSPKDLKPIDWENFNDVYTVFWNFFSKDYGTCREGPTGITIKVCGWIFQGSHGETIDPGMFHLIDNESNIFAPNASGGNSIYVKTFDTDLVNLLKNKFVENDVTKKCFVKGELYYFCRETAKCFSKDPNVYIHNINDIYFEK